jgi:colanic acid biosynthesis glycosyl transferase WcaI
MMAMLAEDLVHLAHHVTVLAAVPHFPSGKVFQGYRHGLWQWQNQKGVQVCRVRVPSGNRANLFHRFLTFMVYQWLATLAGIFLKYDLLFVTNPAIETFLPFIVLGWLRNKPSVYSVHDVYPDVGVVLGIFHHRWVIALVAAIERFCLMHSSRVRILSNAFIPGLNALGVSFSKMVLIYDWADPSLIRPMSKNNPFTQEHDLVNKFVILYAGNIGFSQGLEEVLSAAQILEDRPNIRFIFVGDGPSRNGLIKQSTKMNLSNVLFLPFQPRERLSEVFASANLALVSLSSGMGTDSLPSKTFSYLASGCPILAITDEGNDLWQLIHRSKSGWCITPGQPNALADAIDKLTYSPNVLLSFGKNGREYVIAHHSRQAAARQFEQLFQQIVFESVPKGSADGE